MNFIHTGDIFWGITPDIGKPWAKERYHDIKNTFISLIISIKNAHEPISLLLISGNLFHAQPLIKDLHKVNYLFSTIPSTKVVIIAGEHDYMSDTSHCHNFIWNENVTFIKNAEFESIYIEELNTEIVACSCHKDTVTVFPDTFSPKYINAFKILMFNTRQSNQISINNIDRLQQDFDYIALGNVHKPIILKPNKVAYCGVLEPIKYTETGEHGYIYGSIDNNQFSIFFTKFARRNYISLLINIYPHSTSSGLVQLICDNIRQRGKYNIYKLKLIGQFNPNVEFDFSSIVNTYKISQIIDESTPNYDYNTLTAQYSHELIGLYIKELNKPNMSATEKQALFYGVQAFMHNSNERVT